MPRHVRCSTPFCGAWATYGWQERPGLPVLMLCVSCAETVSRMPSWLHETEEESAK